MNCYLINLATRPTARHGEAQLSRCILADDTGAAFALLWADFVGQALKIKSLTVTPVGAQAYKQHNKNAATAALLRKGKRSTWLKT